MKSAISLLTFFLVTLTPAFCLQIDAATKEDVEPLLEITGARNNMQLARTGAAQQAMSMAAELYQPRTPTRHHDKFVRRRNSLAILARG